MVDPIFTHTSVVSWVLAAGGVCPLFHLPAGWVVCAWQSLISRLDEPNFKIRLEGKPKTLQRRCSRLAPLATTFLQGSRLTWFDSAYYVCQEPNTIGGGCCHQMCLWINKDDSLECLILDVSWWRCGTNHWKQRNPVYNSLNRDVYHTYHDWY